MNSPTSTKDKDNHIYTRESLEILFDACLNKTLGEVDRNGVFQKIKNASKITGIAGMVIEQSILGYPADNRQEPDLLVDGVHTELKTTGIRYTKKKGERAYEAKEPMSITAVSPDKIVNEQFSNSNFWHKLARMLLVYYLYDSETVVPAADYAHFPIKGYQFHEFNEEDCNILKQDWTLVRNFIKSLQQEFDDYKSQYPRLSSELRDKLLYIDTAPKWPNPPRFRLKRSVVTSIVQEHFGNKLEQLPTKYTTYNEIDAKCHQLSSTYRGKTINEIAQELGLIQSNYHKSIAERLVVRMFGGHSENLQKIEIFSKIGLLGKTVVLSPTGRPTEDMKLFTIDFSELQDANVTFEDSSFYDFFANHQFLYIVFEENTPHAPLGEVRFAGFKRHSFSDEFIKLEVRPIWEKLRTLIHTKQLKDVICLDKHGKPIINKKSGTIRSAPNFPKSADNLVFLRGSGKDANNKPVVVNGIHMLTQNLWLAREITTRILRSEKFI